MERNKLPIMDLHMLASDFCKEVLEEKDDDPIVEADLPARPAREFVCGEGGIFGILGRANFFLSSALQAKTQLSGASRRHARREQAVAGDAQRARELTPRHLPHIQCRHALAGTLNAC